MIAGSLDIEQLRALVREVLRDVLPATLAKANASEASNATEAPGPCGAAAPPSTPPATTQASAGVEVVTLRSDAELDQFVRRLLRLFDNPKQRADLQAGRLRFTLGAAGTGSGIGPVRRVERGAVTERLVKEAARDGVTLVLGRRALLTPLAKDEAKKLGVVVEKES